MPEEQDREALETVWAQTRALAGRYDTLTDTGRGDRKLGFGIGGKTDYTKQNDTIHLRIYGEGRDKVRTAMTAAGIQLGPDDESHITFDVTQDRLVEKLGAVLDALPKEKGAWHDPSGDIRPVLPSSFLGGR